MQYASKLLQHEIEDRSKELDRRKEKRKKKKEKILSK